MAILQQRIKIDSDLLTRVKGMRSEVAAITATLIDEGFTKLLYNTPQASGNLVASMAIKAGHGAGSKGLEGGKLPFPKDQTTRQKFARGSMPAIMHAKRNNANVVKNIKAHIEKSSGLWPGVTIYNRLAYAEKVEAMDAGQLRAVNAQGAHAMARAQVDIAKSISRPLLEGTPEWKAMVAKGKTL